ncbi:branched-chain amino acid transport system II carrier protein [Ferrimonas sp. SCSIO 43195]|uniref:branched-chain amino acid transport system II carrier protein n=1 Tax=Ferrimonas sp. SCSIO 43195 TaxID=2822844 RepID=UPI00207630BF|nr:branched-chain amino acid transport system II carrier protein [Ferrimonas sp. SCSIO 43195]USD39266.1 branched-chain amino acid transport system II carrier protein [Ferrimonas sp. SCSIO 43195]
MRTRDITAIGFTAFALFLGAGNLIFPPLLAQQAGHHWLTAMGGFLLSAVGLPALTLCVLGRLPSVATLTDTLPVWLRNGFWLLVFATLGPAFVLPRAVTVAYEMGLAPFINTDALLPFSLVFCGLSLLLALKPGKLVDIIGKFMTPALILMLTTLVIAAILSPQGTPQVAIERYQNGALVNGLLEGYMTLDAIAAVAFGWVIVHAIKQKGVQNRQEIRRYSDAVAGIYVVLMGTCYLAMGYLGATASHIAPQATNGGYILTQYAATVLGPAGQLLLGAITLTACLTTIVGLTNANAEYFQNNHGIAFSRCAVAVLSLTALVSNVGLEQLIRFSLPLILTLCPIAIALVLAAGLSLNRHRYLSALVLTMSLFGGIDALAVLELVPPSVHQGLSLWLPLYTQHLSWLPPCVLLLGALSLSRRHRQDLCPQI